MSARATTEHCFEGAGRRKGLRARGSSLAFGRWIDRKPPLFVRGLLYLLAGAVLLVSISANAVSVRLPPDDLRALANAFRGKPGRLTSPEWKYAQVFVDAIATNDMPGRLAKAFDSGAVHPDSLWRFDEAADLAAKHLDPRDPDRGMLRKKSVVTTIVLILAREAAAGECPALGSLGRLNAAADGWVGEELDERLFRLIRSSPTAVKKCWMRLKPFASDISLQTTEFCFDLPAVLGAYQDRPEILALLKRRAAECNETRAMIRGDTMPNGDGRRER